jgi:MFS family permease
MMEPAASSHHAVLRWLFAIQLVSMAAMEMSGPFWPLHLRTLGQLTQAELAWASGLAYAGPMVMAMCCTPFWGRIGDRVGHKPMVLRALLALAGTQFWIAFAGDVVTLLAARLAQGALAGFIAAAQAYGACLVSGEKRGTLMARLQVATAVGSFAGPLAGGWAFDAIGFRFLNILAAALCLASAAVAWRVLPAATPAAIRKKGTPPDRASFALGGLVGLLLAIVLVQAGKMMPQAFFGLYAEQVLHIPAWMIGLCYGATALGLCIAAPLWGKRFEKQPRDLVLRQVEWICLACAVVVAIQGSSHALAAVILARIVWGVCLAALLPVLYGLLSRDASAHDQGRVLGAGNSAAKAGALAGTAGGALALAWLPLQYAFWPVAAVYVITAIGLRVIRKRLRAPVPVDGEAAA